MAGGSRFLSRAIGAIADRASASITSDRGDIGRRTALVTGSVALGAVLTGSLFRKLRQRRHSAPSELAPALDADTRTLEIMEGATRFYVRDGEGIPVVLLHSINAAASSFEMRPLFDHLAATTNRPLYALDWFGFGRSERPPVRYSPALYLRQLRRFLSEEVHQPVDLVALSLSCEYAAEIARSMPYLLRRLALIAPTGLASGSEATAARRLGVSLADTVGAFEIIYYRLTRPESLRTFYRQQVFAGGRVPDELVGYASLTTNVDGAHHAPRYFVQGDLSTGNAYRAYASLGMPTAVIVPRSADGLIQQFDDLGALLEANPEHIDIHRLPGGLLPHWERPEEFFPVLDSFLST